MSLLDYGIKVEPKEGNQLIICPRCSHDRKKTEVKCLSVNTEKKMWLCHHCSWKGRDTSDSSDSKDMFNYFTSRSISPSTVIAANITCEKGELKFPYTKRWKEVNAKYRRIAEKKFRSTTGGESSLYGLDEVPAGTQRLVWVEGEIDALSMREVGLQAVSVPHGAPNPGDSPQSKLSFLDAPDFEHFLNSIPTHVIAVDEDAPGRTLRDALVSRLGFEKCEIVSWIDAEDNGKTAKDANEFLCKYGRDALIERVAKSKPIPVEGVFTVSDLKEDMYRDFQHGVELGLDVDIPGLANLWTVRKGELSIIHGYPGSGKSIFMARIAVNLARKHGWKFATFPAENLPLHRYANDLCGYYLQEPLRNSFGDPIPLEKYWKAMQFVNEHFSFIMPEEEASLESILSRSLVQIRRWGANAIIIDPWTEVYVATTSRNDLKTDVIERALRKVKKFTAVNGVHFFILAHPSKPKDGVVGSRPPHPSEISGSMQWYNKPDCILAVHRPPDGGNNVDVISQKVRFREIGDRGTAKLSLEKWSGVYSERDDANYPNSYGNRRISRKG